MSYLYNFGLSQEDERTEAAALHLAGDDHVVCIASAGDMPLSLVAMGGISVTAVDIDPAQMALTWLKYASVQSLPREDAIGFLGYLPMDEVRRRECFLQIRPSLPRDVRGFWDKADSAIEGGVIWASRFERYVRWLRRLAMPLLGRRHIEALFECQNTVEQEALFDRSMARASLRYVFRVAFHPRVFSRRGMDPRSLAHRDTKASLGEQYYGWFRSFCTSTLARDNYLLQLTLLGRTMNIDAVPTYLGATGYEVLRNRAEHITFHCVDLIEFLANTAPAVFNKFHLSNICDWLDQQSFERVMRLLVEKSVPGGRAVWRFLHKDRRLPEDLADSITVERAFGQELRLRDRYPFYSIVPAQIGRSQHA